VPRGEHDDRHVALFAQDAAHGQPVHARQHEIEHDQVGVLLTGQAQPLDAVGGAQHIETLGLQTAGQRFAHGGFVFDDEYRRHRSPFLL